MEAKTDKRKCPRCGKGLLDTRVPRAFWVKLFLFWLPIKRYRCDNCNKKIHVYGQPKANAADDNRTKLEAI